MRSFLKANYNSFISFQLFSVSCKTEDTFQATANRVRFIPCTMQCCQLSTIGKGRDICRSEPFRCPKQVNHAMLLPSVISARRQMNCTDCQRHRVLALVNMKAPILVSQATAVSLCCIELILSGSAWKLWHAFINAVIAMRSPPRTERGMLSSREG